MWASGRISSAPATLVVPWSMFKLRSVQWLWAGQRFEE
jgi:hypothetical protein